MNTDTVVETTDLRKEYDSGTAIDGLNLSVPAGTVYGFLGPNGAGKTTTMRILTGLLRPTAGEATVAGVSVDDRDELGEHVGFVPEAPPLYDELSGREQLEYFAALHGLSPATADGLIDDYLRRFDLADDADERIGTYSKGMRRKITLIQGILHDPAVLFLDEPTSGLDPRAARAVRETIRELADGGTAVFLSTHVLSVAEAVADTVGVLYDGSLVAEGPPTELRERAADGADSTLEDVFLAVTDGDESRDDRTRLKEV